MKQVKLTLCILLFLVLGLTRPHAQEAVITSGGDASGSGGSSSYSIGQLFWSTHTGANGSVAQGLQQPYEISVEVGMQEVVGTKLTLSAFPNPVSESLSLTIESGQIDHMRYLLFDVTGKLLKSRNIESNEISIGMGDLMPATYFLKVIRNNKEIQTFKIIKN